MNAARSVPARQRHGPINAPHRQAMGNNPRVRLARRTRAGEHAIRSFDDLIGGGRLSAEGRGI